MLKKVLPMLLVLGVVVLAVPMGVAAYTGSGPHGDVVQAMGAAFGRRGGWRGGGVSLVDATAQATGMDEADVIAALQSGKSYADIAADAGISLQEIVDVVIAARKEALDSAVAEGRISQAQADEMLEEMAEHLLDQLNQPWTARGGFGTDGAQQGYGRMGGGRMAGRRGNAGQGWGTGDPANCPYADAES